MKNIINLVKLQYMSAYSLRKYFLLVFALGLLMAIYSPLMIVFASALILMSLTYSTSSYEEQSKVSYLIHALPVKTTDYIISKYIYGFFNTLIALVFSSTLYIILKTLNIIDFKDLTLSTIIIALICIGTFLTIIVLPLTMILGAEKGRFVVLLFALFPVCFSNDFISILPDINLTINPTLFSLMMVLVTILLTVISYSITSNIYCKRDVI